MRQYFFYGIGALVLLVFVGWFLYAVGKALYTLFDDWRLGKELDELEAQVGSRREQRQLDNQERLDNGCEHDFDEHVIGFPPDVCSKCGLEREKPSDPCDHIWRLQKGAVPVSTCEKCGKTHNPAEDRGSYA